ncbi:MAG: hypothetical protein R3D59_18045 [Paracoccaceae bacterium]
MCGGRQRVSPGRALVGCSRKTPTPPPASVRFAPRQPHRGLCRPLPCSFPTRRRWRRPWHRRRLARRFARALDALAPGTPFTVPDNLFDKITDEAREGAGRPSSPASEARRSRRGGLQAVSKPLGLAWAASFASGRRRLIRGRPPHNETLKADNGE